MIDFYSADTFNGRRVAIMLEETALAYTVHPVNLAQQEQHKADFLQLNPSGRIPVIVDHDSVLDKPLVLTQSTAILQYLAEKTGQLLPESLAERAKTYEWMHFHAVDIGSVIFSAFYLQRRTKPKQLVAAKQLKARIHDLYQYFDLQLQQHEFIAGSQYSIADITMLPAVSAQEKLVADYPHIQRWLQQLKQRPAVQRALSISYKKEVCHAS